MEHKASNLEIMQLERKKMDKAFRFLNASWPYIKVVCMILLATGVGLSIYEKSQSGGGMVGSRFYIEIWSLTWWRKCMFVFCGVTYTWLLLMYGVRRNLAEALGKEEPKI